MVRPSDLVIKVFLIMTVITNTKNLLQYKSRFSFTVEQILASASSPNMVGEVKILFPNVKQIS